MPGRVQVDQVKRGQVRPVPADRVRRQRGGVVAEPGLLNPLPQAPEAPFPLQDIQRVPVPQDLEDDVFPREGMHFRKTPADGPVFAVHRPEDGAALPAGAADLLEKRGDPDVFPFPVPAAVSLVCIRLEGLVLADACLFRLAARDHGHMDRIGQRGKNGLHLPAEGALPHDARDRAVRGKGIGVGPEESVQGYQQDFAHVGSSFP